MSRRSRRNKYKNKKPHNIAELPQQFEPLPSTAPVNDKHDFVGPKAYRQESYRTEHTILLYSLLAFLVFVAIAVIIIFLIHKFAVEQIYS